METCRLCNGSTKTLANDSRGAPILSNIQPDSDSDKAVEFHYRCPQDAGVCPVSRRRQDGTIGVPAGSEPHRAALAVWQTRRAAFLASNRADVVEAVDTEAMGDR